MSLRYEQHRALRKSRDFLAALLTMPAADLRAGPLRERARDCLRHFPPIDESGQPMFSTDRLRDPADDWKRD